MLWRMGTEAAITALGDSGQVTPAQRRFIDLHATIRRRIVLHDLPPGAQIDLEALAKEFSVSRTPLRSVIQRLADDGLVTNRHGVATTVTGIDLAGLPGAMAYRMRLAEMIGDLSARAPDQTVINAMRAMPDRFDALGERPDIRGFGCIDLDLHGCVCRLIGNPHLLHTYDRMFFVTARMWVHFLPRLDWQQEVATFRRETLDWLAAVERGDIRALGFLIRNSLSNVLHRVTPLL